MANSQGSKRKWLAALLIASAGMGQIQPAGAEEAGNKGAEIYCFMRQAGNPHSVSWDAAYARIKRQSSGLFKTSPEHAAVLITETVVTNKDKYSSCAKFLGALYSGREEVGVDSIQGPSTTKTIDTSRYAY
jgi:hypothetical protein